MMELASAAPSVDVNLNLDILRESHHSESQEWLNRSCQDTQTKVLCSFVCNTNL